MWNDPYFNLLDADPGHFGGSEELDTETQNPLQFHQSCNG